jgi:hypothetical protein
MEYTLAFIFNLLAIRKGGLLEIEKDMFHEVDWHSLFIFCLLFTPKCDLLDVGKTMIRLVLRTSIEILSSLAYKN